MLRTLTLALLLVTCAIVTDARAGKVEFLTAKLDEAAGKGWAVEVHARTVAAPTYGIIHEKVSEGVLTLVRLDKLGYVYIPIDEITALSIYSTAPEGYDPVKSKKFDKPAGDKLASERLNSEKRAEKVKSKLDSSEPQKKKPTKGEKGEPDKKGEVEKKVPPPDKSKTDPEKKPTTADPKSKG